MLKQHKIKIIVQKRKTKGLNQREKSKKSLGEEYLALYGDVIAALLDSEYAINEESANNLFDCMTEDALTVITEKYLEEKAEALERNLLPTSMIWTRPFMVMTTPR